MTTKAPSEIKYSGDEELIKKIYSSIEELKEYIPRYNERNRLGYTINQFFDGQIDTLLDAIDQSKVESNIEYLELEKLLRNKFTEKGLNIKEKK